MPRQLNRLSARAVATAKPGKYADGGGLWLQVTPAGVKSWVFRFTRQGKEQFMGLGPAHTVSLAQARQDAQAARMALRDGVDPLAHRRAARAAREAVPTFAEAAAAFIEAHKPGWRSAKHASQWAATLETHAAKLSDIPVDRIATEDVLAVLEPLWTTTTETGSRVRGRIEQVIDAAKAKGRWQGENPARWKGHLDKLLPRPRKVKPRRHYPAMPYADLPAFMQTLRKQSGTAPKALEFLILTAARTGMVIAADWPEVRGDAWHVPADHMKGGRPFTVPLSPEAKGLLDALPRTKGAGIFPGQRGPHLSNAAMDKLLQVTLKQPYTVHGFRSSFKDWASETTSFPNEVSESALAHAIADDTEAAYRRGELLAKRRALMEAWAAYLLGYHPDPTRRTAHAPGTGHHPAPG